MVRTVRHQCPRTRSLLARKESRIDRSVKITSCWTKVQLTRKRTAKEFRSRSEQAGSSGNREHLCDHDAPEPFPGAVERRPHGRGLP